MIIVNHGICLKDDENKIIVSQKQFEKILFKTKYYQRYENYWIDHKYFSTKNPIIEIDLDFTVDSILKYFRIEKRIDTCYYFYHTFEFRSTL